MGVKVMSTGLLTAISVVRAGEWQHADDRLVLDYDERFLRRKRLTAAGGTEFLADLPETTSLDHGDALKLSDGRLVEVVAADEPLLEVTGDGLLRLVWHIGNRHTPCQIGAARLLIRRDHVLAAMLSQLGATLREVEEPFRPEGGAYGIGRTMGHDHDDAFAHQHGEGRHKHVHHHGSHHHEDDPSDEPDV